MSEKERSRDADIFDEQARLEIIKRINNSRENKEVILFIARLDNFS